jgi:hypothetical protein
MPDSIPGPQDSLVRYHCTATSHKAVRGIGNLVANFQWEIDNLLHMANGHQLFFPLDSQSPRAPWTVGDVLDLLPEAIE